MSRPTAPVPGSAAVTAAGSESRGLVFEITSDGTDPPPPGSGSPRLSLPLSLLGMAAMLHLTGDTVSIMSLIGLIMLMGLVTKNAILLVDFAKTLRSRGMNRTEAIVTAGRTRLRPIMMTSLAMIFGMVPLALALGPGAEMRAPMARAVIGGLITSTFLTLIVVPVVYSVLDDLSAWVGRRRKGRKEVHPS